MIHKLTQYRYGKEGEPYKVPIKTVDQVKGLLAYFADPTHENHKGVKLCEPQYHNCDPFGFAAEIGARAEAYRSRPKGRGRPWSGEIAEHNVYAPPEAVALTETERAFIGRTIARRLYPDAPAVWVWHLGEDGRDELHMLGGNINGGHPPMLRVTELRNSHRTGYRMVARYIGEEVIEAVNLEREREQRAKVPTLAECRAEKRRQTGTKGIVEAIFDDLGPIGHDRADIIATLRDRGWTLDTQRSKTRVSITPPGKVKPYRFAWDVLLDQLAALRDTWIRQHIERDERDRQPGQERD